MQYCVSFVYFSVLPFDYINPHTFHFLSVHSYIPLRFPFSSRSLFLTEHGDSKTYDAVYMRFIARYFCRTSALGSQKRHVPACQRDSRSRRRRLMEISRNECQIQKQCNEEFEDAFSRSDEENENDGENSCGLSPRQREKVIIGEKALDLRKLVTKFYNASQHKSEKEPRKDASFLC